MTASPQFFRPASRKIIPLRSWWHEEDLKRSRRETPRRVQVIDVDRFHVRVASYVQDAEGQWISNRRSEILRQKFETGWRELQASEVEEVTGPMYAGAGAEAQAEGGAYAK